MPNIMENAVVTAASNSVFGKRWAISSITGSSVRNELPKSSLAASLSHEKYWICTGLSNPSSSLTASMVSGVGCIPRLLITEFATSPLEAWDNPNARMDAMNSMGIICKIRLITNLFLDMIYIPFLEFFYSILFKVKNF